jgi:hypothetical protein
MLSSSLPRSICIALSISLSSSKLTSEFVLILITLRLLFFVLPRLPNPSADDPEPARLMRRDNELKALSTTFVMPPDTARAIRVVSPPSSMSAPSGCWRNVRACLTRPFSNSSISAKMPSSKCWERWRLDLRLATPRTSAERAPTSAACPEKMTPRACAVLPSALEIWPARTCLASTLLQRFCLRARMRSLVGSVMGLCCALAGAAGGLV